jgi:hypothetical protein
VDPTLAPVTIPEEASIDAMAELALLHVPPAEVSVRVVLAPLQIVLLPVIAEGDTTTVTGFVTKQPVVSV